MHVWAHPELGQTAGAGPGSARVVNHNFGRPPASSAPPKPLSGGRSRPIRDRRDGLKVAFPQCLGMCRLERPIRVKKSPLIRRASSQRNALPVLQPINQF